MKIKTVQKLTMGLLTPAAMAAILMGGHTVAQAAAGSFSETYIADDNGEPLLDEAGRYYLIADDRGLLQSGNAALQSFFAEMLRSAGEESTDTPSVNTATLTRYYRDGRLYADAAFSEELEDLGRLLPGLLYGDEESHSITFTESGETLTICAAEDGFAGLLTGFDGVRRRVFTVSADGVITYQPKLWYDEEAGMLYADEAHGVPLADCPEFSGLGDGEEALFFLAGSDRAIVLRRDASGAAGFLADAHDPSFREPLFRADESGVIRYLGSVALAVEDGTSVQFFFDGESILDGALREAGDVAALAPDRDGMVFSGFYAYEDDVRIPLTNREGVFDADFDDPGFIAWRERIRRTLTHARVQVTGAAEYCYAFTFPAGEAPVSLYSDGTTWFAEEQLVHEVSGLAEIMELPAEDGGEHFAGFYIDGESGEIAQLADAGGELLLTAEEAIAACGGRGTDAYARSYRAITLTGGGDADGSLYYDGDGFYADEALLSAVDTVAIPEPERLPFYGDEEEAAEEDAPQAIGEIVRTCIGYYLADAEGNLILEEEEPKVPVVRADGEIVFDFGGADVPAGDIVAKAVWEEDVILTEEGGDAPNEDPQVPGEKTDAEDQDRGRVKQDDDTDAAGEDTAGDGGDPDAAAGASAGAGASGIEAGTGSTAGTGSSGEGAGTGAGSTAGIGNSSEGAGTGAGSTAGTGDSSEGAGAGSTAGVGESGEGAGAGSTAGIGNSSEGAGAGSTAGVGGSGEGAGTGSTAGTGSSGEEAGTGAGSTAGVGGSGEGAGAGSTAGTGSSDEEAGTGAGSTAGIGNSSEGAGTGSTAGTGSSGEEAGAGSTAGTGSSGEEAGAGSTAGIEDSDEEAGAGSTAGTGDSSEEAGAGSTAGTGGSGEEAGAGSTAGTGGSGEEAGAGSTAGTGDSGEEAGAGSTAEIGSSDEENGAGSAAEAGAGDEETGAEETEDAGAED